MAMLCYQLIKDETVASLRRYADDRIPTGGFLRAVLANDLKEACARADEENAAALFHIVGYIYNELPQSCWGSYERVDKWLAQGGQ